MTELFTWPDYLVLTVVLAVSAAIGFYYALTGGRQKTTKEYLFADRNMHWFPVSCSLLATYISSMSLVSLPGEIYSFGTVILYSMIFTPIGIVIASKFYLPVFQQIRVVSVFKYIEKRYGKPVKVIMAGSNVLFMLMVCGLIIYGPALSMSAVTGINIWASIFTVLCVSTLYTVMGGMKAVLWTDTIQLLIIIAGVLTVLIAGVIREGGPAEVYRINELSGRMDVFDTEKIFKTDLRIRHTFWNMAIDSVLGAISMYGTTQMSVMRAIALKPTHRRLSYVSTASLSFIFKLFSGLIGLVIFAGFRYCDPLKDGEIFTNDQYYPLYVMQAFGKYPGLAGFILSAVFNGSLSTLSSLLSAIATITMEDFIRPWRPKISDKKTTIINKVLAVVASVLSVSFALFAMNYGDSIMSTTMTVLGIFGGPSFALFTMGLLLPVVNRRGAMVGFFMGVGFAAFLGIGGMVNKGVRYKYPVTTEGCGVTDPLLLANISTPIYDPASWDLSDHYRQGFNSVFDMSYAWVKLVGIIVTMITGVIASLIFDCFVTNPEKVNYLMLSPAVVNFKYLPASWKARIDFTEDPSISRKPAQDDDVDDEDKQQKVASTGSEDSENMDMVILDEKPIEKSTHTTSQ